MADLTEIEADSIRDEQLLVEEDIVLTASMTAESVTEDMTKDEIYRIKREYRDQRIKEKELSSEYEWNLQAINLETSDIKEKQNVGKVKVAVLDSGVDWVSGINVIGDVNFVEEESNLPDMFQDMTGHGTGIAAIISGNGENGIYGVNPNAEVYSVKVLDKENKASLSRIVRSIYWCIENDINIINMSFGTPVYSEVLEKAVKDAYDANILMIAAAGNNGKEVEYPAAFDEVMAVAATDANAQISDFSNMGEELDVAAPGEKVRTAGFFDGSVITHGTSIAVPHVTGVASLLWEKDLSKTHEFIRQLIRCSEKEINGEENCGLLDTEYALNIYDDFEKKFDEANLEVKGSLPNNKEKPEYFEHVNGDENYVEGRWAGANHQEMVGDIGLNANEIAIIKYGAIYPDVAWPGKGKNSPWHGRWQYLSNSNNDNYRLGTNINYAAVVDVVTSIALKGGNTSTFTNYAKYKGMDSKLFEDLKSKINSLNNDVTYQTYTNAQRKLFIYGCGIHVLTDVFAHSTTDENGTRINHDMGADNINYRPNRYKAASSAASAALSSLSGGLSTDGYEFIAALEQTYTKTTKYRLINVKKYIVENGYGGYNDAILNLANINKV